MARRSLLWQLFPLLVLVTVVSLLACTLYFTQTLHDFYLNETRKSLESRANIVRLLEGDLFFTAPPEELDALCKELGKASGIRITLVKLDGSVLADSEGLPADMENHATRPEIQEAFAGNVGKAERFSNTLGKTTCYVAVPVYRNGKVEGVARVSVPLEAVEVTLREAYRHIALGFLVIALLASVLGLAVSRRITRPIEQMRQSARRYAQGDLSARLRVPNTTELGQLAEAMNHMALQLQERIGTVERQRNELEAVLSSMVEGVVAVDTEERILNINTAAAELFHVVPAKAVGKMLHEVIRNTEVQRIAESVHRVNEPIARDILLTYQTERFVHVHATPLANADGKSIGGLIVFHDITELRRLENARRDFVSNVSHELKTPITSIKGYAETLLDGALDEREDARRFVEIITRQADRLYSLIEDLLNLSRLEQGSERDEIQKEWVQARQIVEAAVLQCQEKASAKGITIRAESDEDTSVRANAALLQLAVENLLDNAIKYSDENTEVEAEVRKRGNQLTIRVRDHGCGIAKEHLHRIFERFYRVDKARSRKLGGTGLGLAIVKHIARAHHGQATVDSAPQKGSTFCIHIPCGGLDALDQDSSGNSETLTQP
ncbi:MAG: cell wall metabolism sensor histidine kinase WalK [Candidatus Hydrogenedentes bacterium]|nr:cell wall metabolism sensor histidine kinase WalK [Candidatus Hydrogenedentota bacterium]